jgi:arginyl-tRNA synthetase
MLNIKEIIRNEIKRILNTNKTIVVEIPPRENMGDYSVPCFELRNDELKNPNEVANYIKDSFNKDIEIIKSVDVIGPYANFNINYELLSNEVINNIESEKEKYGSLNQGKGETLLIEHTSINPNAEPHMGRCRNSFIGDFMSNLYSFTGYDVTRHYFVNDLGKKIALLVLGVEKYGLNSNNFNDILDVYVKISKEAKEDETIEKKAFDYLEIVESGNKEMIEKFKSITDMCVEGQMKIFSLLNISFDVFTHESDYVYDNSLEEIINKLKEKNRFKIDELGRGYVDLTGYDIPTKEPVLVLTRSNGTYLYPMKDIAYSIYKIKLNDKNNFIVLGEDQEVYMKQISAVLDILGYKSPKLISYGYVLLNGDKMSTSGGVSVLVTDFIKTINEALLTQFNERNIVVDEKTLSILMNASIKYAMLNVSKHKVVDFNIDNATSFKGESGVYILYSIVRINSILKKNNINSKTIKLDNELENKIIKDLYSFPEIINSLLTSNEPQELTKYIFNLTQKFSTYYESVNISNEENEDIKSSRLRLLLCIKQVLTNGLKVLGIDTIEKM